MLNLRPHLIDLSCSPLCQDALLWPTRNARLVLQLSDFAPLCCTTAEHCKVGWVLEQLLEHQARTLQCGQAGRPKGHSMLSIECASLSNTKIEH